MVLFDPITVTDGRRIRTALPMRSILTSGIKYLLANPEAPPTMNVDGYFTVYPSSSSVLLRRTVNGQPAMLVYPHGQGRVIVTSMYSDFAFGQSQASAEERALIRDMISWAKKPEQIPEVRRGEAISLSLNVANHTDTDAASAKVLIYSPDRSVLVSEETVSGLVPAHGSSSSCHAVFSGRRCTERNLPR